ncbi:hypothetical protein [Frankia sp. AgKG'84/4]|uniref:hypothetical protein n=1 Tax=Frankia sp. AgKG'84/4 TaxID=573490 RepID=UPI00200EB36A|nr:hypothetical protein [Frankia sp. AgKG'84/4]MCL9792845.1 hypothetical protein [Frankia sp. AgKG'84/4]
MGHVRRSAAIALGTALALTLAACSSDSSGAASTGSAALPAAPSGSALNLAGTCPATVVVQTDWFAESEYGYLYNLLGPDAKIDTGKKRIVGSLVSGGRNTGVKIEVRYGGPAIGFEQVSAQMYVDKSITLGIVSTDESIQNSVAQPTKAVFAPFDVSPMMIMWDKSKYPNFTTLVDIGQTDTKVLYYQTDAYMQYLLGAGILRQGQVDGSYDGSPSRWVTEDGKVAEAGFATSEPYIYKNELDDRHSYDVNLQLINDTGYPVYGQTLAARGGDEGRLAPCLKKLVPIIQQSQADFMANPKTANDLIIKAVKSDAGSVWNYSPGLATYAVQTMKDRGLVSNGSNSTIGDMDQSRISRMIQILTPIYAGQKKPVRNGLSPTDLFTNQYLNTSIGLK